MSVTDAQNTLNRLGLTRHQAKVYLYLVGKEPTSTNEIARYTSMNRGNIHTTLNELLEIGLVEKIISNPTTYKAAPVEEAVSFLIANKTHQLSQIERQAEELINQTKKTSNQKEHDVDRNMFTLALGQRLIAKTVKAYNNATFSIDFITSFRKFCSWLSVAPDIHLKALKRGVKSRVILNKPEINYSMPKAMNDLMQKPNFTIHYVPTIPKTHLAIYDDKLVIFNTSTVNELAKSPCYFTENPNIVSMIKEYFEMLWSTSAKRTS